MIAQVQAQVGDTNPIESHEVEMKLCPDTAQRATAGGLDTTWPGQARLG